MSVQIDQSGKIEQTNLDTIIALSNEVKYAIVLKKKTKRLLQLFFRKQKKPRMFIYITFAALVAIILKETQPKTKVKIDMEYFGHQDILKKQILEHLNNLKFNKKLNFEFGFVGKSSPAHGLASKVAVKKRKPNKIVGLYEIIKVIYP